MFPMTTAYPPRAGRHQRPFNHPPAEVSPERKRWGETHESLILDSCRMLDYSTATLQVKADRGVNHWVQSTGSESSTWSFPSLWQLINVDLLLLIWSLFPTTITNNSIIAMAIMGPIHITTPVKGNDGRWEIAAWFTSQKLILFLSYAVFKKYKRTSASPCPVVLWWRQSAQSPY